MLIVLVVIIIAVLILALKKKNTEKYVLNYSTVYGKLVHVVMAAVHPLATKIVLICKFKSLQ